MKSRILVAAIGVPLLYLVILSKFHNNLIFAIGVSVACAIASLELSVMLRPMAPWVPVSLISAALAPMLAWRMGEVGIFLAVLVSIPLILTFQGLSVDREKPLTAICATMLSVAWITPAAGLIVVLRQAEAGFDLVIVLIACVFLNDTAAYFVGKTLGRHKLAPRISPNKSIEGFVGGVTVGTLVVWYSHFIIDAGGQSILSGWEALGIGLAVSLAGPLGDLFESMVKRAAKVKDSGNILGGHGGILDRIDALLIAIPVFYVGCFFAGAL